MQGARQARQVGFLSGTFLHSCRQSEEGHNVEDMGGGVGKVTVTAGFSVGVWLVTFQRSGFRSDCYLSRLSSETSDGVATSV